MDLAAYRQSENERRRLEDLLRLLPNTGGAILEIGPRDGYHSGILKSRFASVIGVDLDPPKLSLPGVQMTKASVTALPFKSGIFSCVLCAEVLEHVQDLESAAAEITRVTCGVVVIGVPFRQDIRVGKLTCSRCGRVNPPYGHINTFDEQKLKSLFHRLELVECSFVGKVTRRTNPLSSWLMTKAGNPWAAYNQEEPCIFCGSHFEGSPSETIKSRACASLAYRLDRVQQVFLQPSAAWIHALFRKPA